MLRSNDNTIDALTQATRKTNERWRVFYSQLANSPRAPLDASRFPDALREDIEGDSARFAEWSARLDALKERRLSMPEMMELPGVTGAEISEAMAALRSEEFAVLKGLERIIHERKAVLDDALPVLEDHRKTIQEELEQIRDQTRQKLAQAGITVESMRQADGNMNAAHRVFSQRVDESGNVKAVLQRLNAHKALVDDVNRLRTGTGPDLQAIRGEVVGLFRQLTGL